MDLDSCRSALTIAAQLQRPRGRDRHHKRCWSLACTYLLALQPDISLNEERMNADENTLQEVAQTGHPTGKLSWGQPPSQERGSPWMPQILPGGESRML